MAPTMKLVCALVLFASFLANPIPCEASSRRLLDRPEWVTEMLEDGTALKMGDLKKIHPTRGNRPQQQYDPGMAVVVSPGTDNNNGILYHGGSVMLAAPVKTYVIFYGNWAGNSATSIVTTFLSKIGGTPYFNIIKLYTDGSGRAPSGQVSFGGSITSGYTYGTSISDSQTVRVVSNAFQKGKLPVDANAVYFVVTSADVNQYQSSTDPSAFCSAYCGYHSSFGYGTTTIKYSFIGNVDRCPNACSGYPGNAPNGNAGGDGMVSIIAHELEETVSDQLGNAWYDAQGEENADKCAYQYGTTFATSNGQTANVNFGGTNYLVQQNWKPAGGGYCALS